MNTGAADHHRIMANAQAWRGMPMALATVIETWRSAPCPVGTHMLIRADGQFVGSVSGGCVEGDVLRLATEMMAQNSFAVRRYGVADGSAWEVGLPCGGDIVVLVQNVAPDLFPEQLFDSICAAAAAGVPLLVGTNIETGMSESLSEHIDGVFINHYLPPRRLMIIGAVEIASALSDMAQALGVDVTIIDPRAAFLTPERFPGITLDDRWPDEAITALQPDARTAIVTLSHDPKIDDPALAAALKSPAAYVAALGSKSSHAKRLERLTAAGVPIGQLARIDGPAGIAINAISAPEIALSIASAMVRAFNDGLR